MSNMTALKRRTKSVRSTRQITKAMELISASKMRRASQATLASRYYSEVAKQILGRLHRICDVEKHPLYDRRPVKSRLYIVIASNRGLSGSYNKNVLQSFANQLKNDAASGIASHAILIGKQAGRFAARLQGLSVVGLYDSIPELPTTGDISPLLSTAIQLFAPKLRNDTLVDEVVIIYTKYISNLTNMVSTLKLLPAGSSDETTEEGDTLFEPGPDEVLSVATHRFIEVQLLQAYLESQASEQSARMLAMKTASDNASDLIDDLVLASNTLRQSTITQELAEITGGTLS